MSKRSTKAETAKRINHVQQLILDGIGTYEIVRFATEQWDVKRRQVEKYIQVANEQIEEIYEKELKNKLSWHHIARRRLYKKALQENQTSVALNILKDMADLEGHYKNIHELTGRDGQPVEFKSEFTELLENMNEDDKRELRKILLRNRRDG